MTDTPLPELRPLGAGEMLDKAIRLYRRNFLTFIAIIAVVQIPIAALQFLFSWLAAQNGASPLDFTRRAQPGLPTTFTAAQASAYVVGILSFVLVQGVATAAMTRAVADSTLGTPTGFADAYRRIGRSWLPLLGTLFLAGFLTIGLIIWFIVPCVGWATGLGIIIYYSAVMLPLLAPIVVLERKSGFRAVRRAWDLARRRFWAVLGFMALMFLFSLIIVTGPNLLFAAIFGALIAGSVRSGSAVPFTTIQLVAQSLLGLLSSLVYVPLQLVAVTLLYLDLRVRTEGLDLAMLTQDASADTPDALLNSQAPTSERGGLITWRELLYFFLISLGVGAVYAVFVVGFAALLLMLGGGGLAG